MGARSKIEWTDSTWPVVTGCTKISDGCANCYADAHATRFAGTKAWPNGFQVTQWPQRLDKPLRWRRPRKVFVCSTADLFHADVSTTMIAKVWAAMALSPRHTFQILTKRPARMRSLLRSEGFYARVHRALWCDELAQRRPHGAVWERAVERFDPRTRAAGIPAPLPNVWLGVSVENQFWADRRIPLLLDIAAYIRFISAEPLLGPIDLAKSLALWTPPVDHDHWAGDRLPAAKVLHWVIAGGESGPKARPMHPDWARGLRDQCAKGGIAFHFKQFGEYVPVTVVDDDRFEHGRAYDAPGGARMAPLIRINGEGGARADSTVRLMEPGERSGSAVLLDRDTIAIRVGKARAGRVLDGRTWDDYPAAAAQSVDAGAALSAETRCLPVHSGQMPAAVGAGGFPGGDAEGGS